MAVNKNFVVKNGLEVDTDLIFADASTDRVGIGSTIPSTALDVKGGIAVTDINASGIGTIVTLRSTTGIITTVDAISVQATNLNISGVTTVVDIGPRNLNVSGVTSTTTLQVIGTGNMDVGIVTNVQGTNINYSGIGTIANVIFTKDAAGLGATIGAAVGVVTYYGDGANLLNTGSGIGIGSTGTDGLGASGLVGYGFTYLSFVGSGVSMVQYNTSVGIATVWIAGGGGGSGNVSIGSEAPGSPNSGDLWYSTEYGTTFIWFDEVSLGIGNTAVWVDSSPFNQGGKFISKYGDNAYGAIGYTGGTTSQASIYYTSDPNTGIYFPSTDHVGVVAGGTASLVVNPNGVTVTGILTGNGSGLTGVASTDYINTGTAVTITNNVSITGVTTLTGDVTFTGDAANVTWDKSADDLIFGDNAKAAFGDGSDLSIYHDESHSRIVDSGTGHLIIQTSELDLMDAAGSEDIIKATANGSVELYYDNSKKFETDLHGTITTGVGTATGGLSINADDKYLTIGDGGDLRLFHSSSVNIIDSPTSRALTVKGDGITFRSSANENYILANNNGSVDIYYNNTKRIETASDDAGGGVIVTGKVVGTAATIGTGVTINNTGIDMGIAAGICTAKEFYGDGSNLTGIAAGGSGEFNTSISGATQYDVTTSMATAYTANASASHRTIVHSIHICNVSASEVTISGEIQSSFSLAHTIPVPAGSAVELLKQPKVLGPSETIELQASANSALEATIVVEYKEDTDYWDAAIDLTSAATMTDIYTSTGNPSVVQSILLANDDGTLDVKARVAWTDGSDNVQSYLCYDMIIPADSTVELCEKPKYLASGYKLRGYANQADRLEITASGKQITS